MGGGDGEEGRHWVGRGGLRRVGGVIRPSVMGVVGEGLGGGYTHTLYLPDHWDVTRT